MSRTGWKEHVADLHRLLGALSCTDGGGRTLDAEAAFARWRTMTLDVRGRRKTIYLVGNGASASMASHMSADLAKNARVHTQVFSDLSLITAISNDLGYEHVFSEPLSRRASAGDLLVAISSSGRSPNVLAAVRVAKKLRLTIVTLSGMNPKNPLRKAGHLNFHVPAGTYGYAESCHAAVLHHWMDLVESKR
jgi:D-sedoheptulose 7-phosphate isomerase